MNSKLVNQNGQSLQNRKGKNKKNQKLSSFQSIHVFERPTNISMLVNCNGYLIFITIHLIRMDRPLSLIPQAESALTLTQRALNARAS